jgi:putative transposase
VDEILIARDLMISCETVRQWALKFGQMFGNQIRHRLPRGGGVVVICGTSTR